MNVTSAYIELCVTGKTYHSIELADSFLLKYRLLQTSQLALYERSFERPASLSGVQLTQIALEPISEDLESKTSEMIYHRGGEPERAMHC